MINIHNNIWTIETNLTLKTVQQLYIAINKSIANLEDSWIIDFKKCSKVDSSGLSLMIECIKHAQKNNIELELENVNIKALALAKVHGAEHILKQFIKI